MKIIILHPDVAKESAALLLDSFKLEFGKSNCYIDNPYNSGNRDYSSFDMVFKYGFSKKIKTKGIVLNKTKSLELVRNKINTFQLFEEEGFTVPFTLDIDVAKDWAKKSTVVCRQTEVGSNGNGVSYCGYDTDVNQVKSAKFYTKYVDHTNEFRVYIWRNQVVSIYDKVVPNQFFRFKLFKGQEKHPQLVEMVEKIYKKTKLDWYGLDVLRDKDGTLHLLEINSAPVLFPYTIKKLTTIIKNEMEKENV